VVPRAIDEFAGVTAIDVSVAEVTFSDVKPLMVPDVAVMLAEPTAIPVANPALLMLAIMGTEELQVTELVRF